MLIKATTTNNTKDTLTEVMSNDTKTNDDDGDAIVVDVESPGEPANSGSRDDDNGIADSNQEAIDQRDNNNTSSSNKQRHDDDVSACKDGQSRHRSQQEQQPKMTTKTRTRTATADDDDIPEQPEEDRHLSVDGADRSDNTDNSHSEDVILKAILKQQQSASTATTATTTTTESSSAKRKQAMMEERKKKTDDDDADSSAILQPPSLTRADAPNLSRHITPGAVSITSSLSSTTTTSAAGGHDLLPQRTSTTTSSTNETAASQRQQPLVVANAVKVEDNVGDSSSIRMEEAIELAKDRLLRESVQATQVLAIDDDMNKQGEHHENNNDAGVNSNLQKDINDLPATTSPGKRQRTVIVLVVLILIIIGVVVGTTVGLKNRHSSSSSSAAVDDSSSSLSPTSNRTTDTTTAVDARPTLQRVLERGYLKCGIASGIEKGQDEQQDIDAFTIRMCRAIAASIFGFAPPPESAVLNNETTAKQYYRDQYHLELLPSPNSERWELIHNRIIDVTINMDTMTMDRDVYLDKIKSGVEFGIPYGYAGVVADGVAEYVDCVDRIDSFFGICRNVTICLRGGAGTTERTVLSTTLPGALLVTIPYNTSMPEALVQGRCNVVVQNALVASEEAMRLAGFIGEYARGKDVYSRDPLAMITRTDDQQRTDLCNWGPAGLVLGRGTEHQ